MTITEPEFTEQDLLNILASRREESRPRGTHGRLLSEATDRENQYRYRVPLPHTDFAAAALAKAQNKYRQEYGDEADMSSLLWSVELD